MKDLFKNSAQKNLVAGCKKIFLTSGRQIFLGEFLFIWRSTMFRIINIIIFSPINGLVVLHCLGPNIYL